MLKHNSIKVHSNTRPHWQLALEMRTGWPYGWFWKFLNGLAKSPRFMTNMNIDWVQFVLKNYEIPLSFTKVCLINSTYCFTSDVMVYTPPDLLARICGVNLSNVNKLGLICFPRICFRGLIYCDQEPLWLMNVIEDFCYFSLGVHIRLSTRCKMFHCKIT